MRHIPWFIVSALVIGPACDDATTRSEMPEPARGALGKADTAGSCAAPAGEDYCGGQSDGRCWCDRLCVEYDDCCADREAVCESTSEEPAAPGTCGVGADGCCSNLLGGGSDPDCANLTCDQLQITEPILLPDLAVVWEERRGGTAMVWTGESLLTARIDAQSAERQTDWNYIFEVRDAEGTLQSTTQTACSYWACRDAYGPTSLAHDRETDQVLFGYFDRGGAYEVSLFDEARNRTERRGIGFACHATTANIEVMPAADGFIVGVDDNACGGPGGRNSRVYAIAGDATLGFRADFGSAHHHASFACGDDCNEVVSFGEVGAMLVAGHHNVASGGLPSVHPTHAQPLYGGVGYTETVFNGEDYFVVAQTKPGPTWQLGTSFYDPTSESIVGIAHGGVAPGMPPSMVWTGDGYLMAVATHEHDQLDHFHELTGIQVYHFAVDGSLRESFVLDPSPSLYPQLAYVDGRVAISWVRDHGSAPQTRHLAFLGC